MSFFNEKNSCDHSGWSPDVVPSFGLARISCDLGSPILSRTDPYSGDRHGAAGTQKAPQTPGRCT